MRALQSVQLPPRHHLVRVRVSRLVRVRISRLVRVRVSRLVRVRISRLVRVGVSRLVRIRVGVRVRVRLSHLVEGGGVDGPEATLRTVTLRTADGADHWADLVGVRVRVLPA